MITKRWLLLPTLLSPLIAMAGGCGDDETPELPVVVPDAGNNGAGGISDPEAGIPLANFGQACERHEDCGPDLACLPSKANSVLLTEGGPPRGLCTAACDDDPDVCLQFARNARCATFGSRAYCVEGCEFGSTLDDAFDAKKCHGRTEFACKPTLIDTRVSCEDSSDCEADELCSGTCWRELPSCMPQCNGDQDCESGWYCDPSSGECVRDVPHGQRLTERCSVSAVPDPCRGRCGLIDRERGDRCDETCTLGAFPACGPPTNPPAVGCVIPVTATAKFGDMGYCARLCDCTADCPEGLECVVSDAPYLQRPGYCKEPDMGDALRSSCSSGGSGGSTGSGGSAGSTGGGGSGGSGGSTSGGSGGTGFAGQAGAAGAEGG